MHNLSPLYREICSMANIWKAAHRTLLEGRRYKGPGAEFKLHYESYLLQIHNELASLTYQHGEYSTFYIYEPKQRLVLAAPIKDRVVHHALHDVIEPMIDKKYIFDSYACRKDKGTHKAISRAQKFLQANEYVMHLDVKKYFPSINHETLKCILKRHIKDQQVLALFDTIINSPHKEKKDVQVDLFCEEKKGLPIGNLTSQFLANLYLNELDQYVKHVLKIKYYVRYMDDFVVFGNDKEELLQTEKEIISFCIKKLQLSLHLKGGIKRYSEGFGFLGFRIFRKHKRLKSVCINRYLQKYKKKSKAIAKGMMPQEDLQRSIDTWQNHISFGDTLRLQHFLKNKYNMNLIEAAS